MKHRLTMLLAILSFTPTNVSLAADKTPSDKPRGTIAFASQAPRGFDVYAVTIADRKTTRLTEHPLLDFNAAAAPDGKRLAFVSERDGNMEIYSMNVDGSDPRRLTRDFALDDHPSWSPDGKRLVFTSTRQPSGKPGQSWNALYVMNADGSEVKRLSPPGVSDLSPAWSPTQDLIAFVSHGQGICVAKSDGTERRIVVKEGGWPTWSGNGERLYFHKQHEGRWGVFQVRLDGSDLKRVSPADLDVCTPSGSLLPDLLAVATFRTKGRQIELLDTASGKLSPVTDEPGDHWNPSLAPDGKTVYYHKVTPGLTGPRVEKWGTPPGTELNMLRVVDGMFPAFSPDGKRIAMIDGIFGSSRHSVAVMNRDGTGHKKIWTGKKDLFGLSWGHKNDLLSFSMGGYFRDARTEIDIATVRPDGSDFKTLIADGSNNGWLSFAPDGKRFVFRSGQSGAKNLYIANLDGSGVKRLTEGNWTDTMCHWSPTGEWIAFASNRDGDFHLWLIKPDGSGLRKVLGGARHNHPHFSPDGQWLVFASGYAGISAEAVSLPRTDEPFGELFAVRLDGSGLTRLTHNGSSEGTPDWAMSLTEVEVKFKITTKRKDDRVEASAAKGSVVFDVHSPFGIGQAVIERQGDAWPERVTLRLHLKGMEQFRASVGKLRLEAALSVEGVLTQQLFEDGKQPATLNEKSRFWLGVRLLGEDGKPAKGPPLKDGFIEVTLPPAFFEGNPPSLTLNWVDFFRN